MILQKQSRRQDTCASSMPAATPAATHARSRLPVHATVQLAALGPHAPRPSKAGCSSHVKLCVRQRLLRLLRLQRTGVVYTVWLLLLIRNGLGAAGRRCGSSDAVVSRPASTAQRRGVCISISVHLACCLACCLCCKLRRQAVRPPTARPINTCSSAERTLLVSWRRSSEGAAAAGMPHEQLQPACAASPASSMAISPSIRPRPNAPRRALVRWKCSDTAGGSAWLLAAGAGAGALPSSAASCCSSSPVNSPAGDAAAAAFGA